MWSSDAGQHLVFDAEIVDGLVHAWKARRALGLSEETAAKIADRIHRVASSRFWRWPTIRLNQVNWYALMYAADATVTGRPGLLRHDLRAQLARFVRGRNFGAGMRFQYLPHLAAYARSNLDSAEYANIVLSFLRFYNQARRAGMAPLSRAGRSLVRRWERRAIAGYWTHAGYLNWDSGLGFDRWHQAKKLGLAQLALIGIAQARRLQPASRWGTWAKWMLDRGLRFYEQLPVGEGGLPDPVLFKLFSVPQSVGSARLAAARLQANAARAVAAGLGRMRAAAPPPLYAFDPDIGRLAVTTPVYNTAIVAVNQRAFPYGGIELARLFDGDQRVAANVGGRAPAAFGLLVREPNGRRVFSSQTARARDRPGGHAAAAHAGADRDGGDRGHRAGRQGLRRAVQGSARARHADRRALPGRHLAPLHAQHDRDQLAARAPLRARAAARRRPVAELGRRERPRRGGPERRHAPQSARRRRRAALARQRGSRSTSRQSGYTVVPLRRPAGAVARVLDALTPVVEPRSGPDARDRDRARLDVAASSLRRPDRRRALAARRLREDQLAAAQRGSDLAGLLDLRVRVADRDSGSSRYGRLGCP